MVRDAVEAAIRKAEEKQQAQLAEAARAREEEKREGLYRHSCSELLKVLDDFVEEFNSEFQHGKIMVHREALYGDTVYIHRMLDTTYSLPTGGAITCYFFPRRNSGPKVRGAMLIGGGFIGIRSGNLLLFKEPIAIGRGRSANLLLLKDREDDLYGRWLVCEINISALANAQKLIGQFGITARTVFPFGFEDANHFFDQMQWASGGMHVFTYSLKDDVKQYFAELMKDAIEGQP